MFFKQPKFLVTAAIGAGLVLGSGTAAAVAQGAGAELEMLSSLAKGEWTIKFRDGSADRKICVKTGQELIQLRHTRSDCSQFVVNDSASRATVQYTCRGDGYGRTDLRRESRDLVQVESQGIAGGAPFQFAAEARRTGNCAP